MNMANSLFGQRCLTDSQSTLVDWHKFGIQGHTKIALKVNANMDAQSKEP